jgi:DNA-binding IclR family transcriptional regulator
MRVAFREFDDRRAHRIKSLARGLRILEVVAGGPAITLQGIADRVGLSPATVFNLAATLTDWGYLDRDRDTKRFRLGPKIYELGEAYRRGFPLVDRIKPIVHRVHTACRERVTFGTLTGVRVVYVYILESDQTIMLRPMYDPTPMVHCTAMGKVLLSCLEPALALKIVEYNGGFQKLTSRTITEPKLFLQELKKVRRLGFAENREEQVEGLCALGVPLETPLGDVVGGLTIAVPNVRYTRSYRSYLLALAKDAQREARDALACERQYDLGRVHPSEHERSPEGVVGGTSNG